MLPGIPGGSAHTKRNQTDDGGFDGVKQPRAILMLNIMRRMSSFMTPMVPFWTVVAIQRLLVF